MVGESKLLRCAIYTRKSTEHGLELEFNSLDAQRDACEAYIKSQASQGWRALPQHYDDPAYSGGNLDRPALKALLADIEARKIDVVVVYKIDRLTRSLADFAKLVEAFDNRSISFVAVTQQFNTTTSMGRLTLNVLLSFAQFERELSSERVRDKIAASRRKGKWTGGTVPLGYDGKDKKLVVNRTEAETVRTIFHLYQELKSFSKLVAELDRRGIVTKRRNTKISKYNGGIPFTYGPLAYFLKNRIYLGKVHHGGKWFEGEHKAIIDHATFDRVQELLKFNSQGRKVKRSDSGALLLGKLYDDRGNLMSPSFSGKNGIRYRFYISSAVLRGKKAAAGSVARVAAEAIEQAIIQALRARTPDPEIDNSELLSRHLLRAQIGKSEVKLFLRVDDAREAAQSIPGRELVLVDSVVNIPWSHTGLQPAPSHQNGTHLSEQPDQKLIQALVRAHRWAHSLARGEFGSVEELASGANLHPKVVRSEIRMAFLAPEITDTVLTAGCSFGLADLRKIAALNWQKQLEELHRT
jgi:DNA invertase Pin-like site-specific DNA recombinase